MKLNEYLFSREATLSANSQLFPLPVPRGRAREGVLSNWRAIHGDSTNPPPQPSPGIPGEGEIEPSSVEIGERDFTDSASRRIRETCHD
jgi:hypothetical protein